MKNALHTLVAAVLAFASLMPYSAGPAHADQVDLSGDWKDTRGPDVAITQSGNSVTMKVSNGRVLTGTLDGPRLSVEGEFDGSEVTDAPPEVQAAITLKKLKIKFAGILIDDKIRGKEQKPDQIKWNNDNQLTELKVGSGKPVTLLREKARLVVQNPPDSPMAEQSVDSLYIRAPYFILLHVPKALKADAEDCPVVQLKSANASASIQLERNGGKDFDYGFSRPLTLQDGGDAGCHTSTAGFLFSRELSNAMRRMDSGETITASYDHGAIHAQTSFRAFNRPIDQSLARARDALRALSQFFSAQVAKLSGSDRQSVADKLQVIAGCLQAVEYDDSGDAFDVRTQNNFTKLRVANACANLVQTDSSKWTRVPATSVAYSTKDPSFAGNVFFKEQADAINSALAMAKSDLAAGVTGMTMQAASLTLHTIANMTGATDLNMLVFGQDADGHNVDLTTRLLAGVSLASWTTLAALGPRVAADHLDNFLQGAPSTAKPIDAFGPGGVSDTAPTGEPGPVRPAGGNAAGAAHGVTGTGDTTAPIPGAPPSATRTSDSTMAVAGPAPSDKPELVGVAAGPKTGAASASAGGASSGGNGVTGGGAGAPGGEGPGSPGGGTTAAGGGPNPTPPGFSTENLGTGLTDGWFRTTGGRDPLNVSSWSQRPDDIHDANLNTTDAQRDLAAYAKVSEHAEGRAAMYMNTEGIKQGWIDINNPKGPCLDCRQYVQQLLPADSSLTVRWPTNVGIAQLENLYGAGNVTVTVQGGARYASYSITSSR